MSQPATETPEAITEASGVDALVETLLSQEKQNSETIFAEPPKPAFMVDEVEEPETDVFDEEIEEPGAEAFVGAKTGKGINSEFYAGGFVDFYSWIMASLLAWLNDTDPEEYAIDNFEEKELIESSAAMMQTSGRKFTPGQRFGLASVIIWGKPLAFGLWKKGKKLFAWFGKRNKPTTSETPAPQISEAPAAPATTEPTVTITETEAKAIFEQMKAEAVAIAAKEIAEAANKATAKAPKAKAAEPKAKPAEPEAIEAPTLQQLKEKHSTGLCIYPGCTTATSGKFCGNDHRLAYTKQSNRAGSSWPSSKSI